MNDEDYMNIESQPFLPWAYKHNLLPNHQYLYYTPPKSPTQAEPTA